MDNPILSTKFFLPEERKTLVIRKRLFDLLNDGLNKKLTIISAPAGYGKTTLISSWVRNTKYNIAWLSIDEGDNNPPKFLSCLAATLHKSDTIDAKFAGSLQKMLLSTQTTQLQSILIQLINEISEYPEKVILVLDDYHLIHAQPIDEALAILLENLPAQMHIVIVTREDPKLPLARLRGRNNLSELRAKSLRFSQSEAAEFLNNVMGLDLSSKDITKLENRTEGWIAGLQLAAISLQNTQDVNSFIQSFSGSHRFILDYLIEEVLEQQTDQVQAFLLQTAVLDRLNGSLCDALTDQEDCQETLEKLDQANLFVIPLDNERRWFRYHHLFADLLRQRLRQNYPEKIAVLHQRASDWYEKSGFIDEAIEHALQAKSFERAATLIEDQFRQKYESGDHIILRRWMAELPQELILAKPNLCIIHAWNLFTSGQLDAADRSLQRIEMMLDPDADLTPINQSKHYKISETDRKLLLGRASAIWAFVALYKGKVSDTILYARRALKNLPANELSWREVAAIALGDVYMNKGEIATAYKARLESLVIAKASGDIYLHMLANLKLAETLRQQGKLSQAIEICEQQMRIAEENGISESVAAGWLMGIWGEVLAELNDLNEAEEKAKKGVELTERGKDMAMIGWSNLYLLRVLFSKADFTDAENVIKKMESIIRKHELPTWIPGNVGAWQVRLWLKQDRLDLASRWAEERGRIIEKKVTYLHESEQIMLAHILVAQEQFEKSAKLSQRLLKAAEAGGRTSRAIRILILQALSSQKQGNIEQGIAVVEKALELAKPGGFIRTFVDEGPLMARLLYKALSSDFSANYIKRLLAAFPDAKLEETESQKSHPPDYGLIEPLSDREIEVLQLMAEGMTNPQIASQLFVTLNTVKVHSRNIYAKLGVNNRTQAGLRAKALGILPSI